MLKRMSRRFIGAAMAAITAVVLVLLCCLNLWNYRGVADQLDSTLDLLAAADGSWPDFALQQPAPPRGGGPFSGEMPYMIRFFAVHYDAGGNITGIDHDFIASVSEEEAAAYAAGALAGGQTRGFYGGYRYLVSGDGGAKSVIFLNAERELGTVRSLLATTAAVAALCLAAVFILVLLLARRAVKPYMRNLEMQKQFITNAGHELKTPLTAISTSADVLALELGDDEWVRNIQTQSARLSKLVAGLVTLLAPGRGGPPAGKGPLLPQRRALGGRRPLRLADKGRGQVLFAAHRGRPHRDRRPRRRAAGGEHTARQRRQILARGRRDKPARLPQRQEGRHRGVQHLRGP